MSGLICLGVLAVITIATFLPHVPSTELIAKSASSMEGEELGLKASDMRLLQVHILLMIFSIVYSQPLGISMKFSCNLKFSFGRQQSILKNPRT